MSFVYMNRYKRFNKSSDETDPLDAYTLALASLSLATKGTESPRRLREFLLPSYRLLRASSSPPVPPLTFPSVLYDSLRATLVQSELIVLRVLKFELRLVLPFEFLPRYLDRTVGELNTGGEGWGGTEDYEGMERPVKEEYAIVGMLETSIGRAVRARVVEA
jgi:hypothetical protein